MKKLLLFRTILVMVLLTIVLTVPTLAQDDAPTRTGLRPDAPTYAIRGMYAVGTQEFVIDDDNGRALLATIWYPALNPDGAEEAHNYLHEVWPAPVLGHALFEAAPDMSNAPYPLIIFSHSRYAFRFQSTFLTEHLASQGFVVMTVDHEDNFAGFGTDTYFSSYLSRPQDVSRQIDYAEMLNSDGMFAGMIDTEYIGVIGHSFGGLTALLSAGAQLDLVSFKTWCDAHPDVIDPFGVHACQAIFNHEDEMLALAGLDTAPETLWPGYSDARVDAIVSLAGGGRELGETGASAITIPTLFLYGTGDDVEDYTIPFEAIASEDKAMLAFKNAGHNIFIDDCSTLPGFIEAGFFMACSDSVWDMNRVHDLTNHFSTAFFLAELMADGEAFAALHPEAVYFPGVEYTSDTIH